MTPAVDRSDMALFVEVLFRYCDDGGYVSLRTFRDDIDGVWRPDLWATPQVNGSLSTVINAALKLAEAAAGAPVPVVFAPPVATFKSAKGAAEKDIAAGPALSVECDDNPFEAREILENILGPATVTVASGGLWTDPESAEVQDKVHLHWRLTEPTRDLPNHIKLKEARRFATMLVGADASAVPLVHPLRWPGSLHRKAEPRLARIVNLRPEIEIELDDALEALKDAVAALPPGENGRDPTAPGGGYTPEIGRQPSRFGAEAEALDIVSALAVIANKERNWKRWSDIGMAVWHASSGSSAGYAAFLAWSSKFDGVDPGKTRERWEHFGKHPPGAIGAGSLFHMARKAWPGWEKPSDLQRRRDNDPGDPPPHGAAPAGGAAGNEEAGWEGPPPEVKPWPEMDAEAFHGLAGEIVDRLDPITEADPVAILVQLLVVVGNAVGRHAHCLVGNVRHYANLFAVVAGITSKGRKGTSYDPIETLLHLADPAWVEGCVKSGLSSGEGIVHAVHDDIWSREKVPQGGKGKPPVYENVLKEPAVADKRLFVIEQEFANALSVMNRPGNSLSPVMRLAWDGRPMQTLTKNNPEKATGAHVSIIGHITVNEFSALLDGVSKANGFANRFLCIMARRSKLLPFPGQLDNAVAEGFAARLNQVLTNVVLHQQITFHPEAKELWSAVYGEISAEKPGLFGAVVARAEAQVLRLALVYAILDQYRQIHPEHLRAALAVWRYCEASARYIFGDALGDPVADTIMQALRQHSAEGMTRTQISEQLFGRNTGADRIGAALALLLTHGMARSIQRSSGGRGRPVEIWMATC